MRTRSLVAGILTVLCLAGCAGCGHAAGAGETPEDPVVPDEQPARTSYADTALVGNSYVEGFYTYGTLPDAACFYRVGLNVNTVMQQPMLRGDDTETPVIDLLEGKDFSHIVFFFGENELGWTNREAFVQEYTEVIEKARSYCPEATIYLSAIPPVSAAVSEKNEDNTNNDAIRACNEEIEQIAQENDAVYIDAFSALADDTGCLPADAAADGIHPAQAYTEKWAELIGQKIAEAETE